MSTISRDAPAPSGVVSPELSSHEIQVTGGGWLRELQEAEISSLGFVSNLEGWWDRPGQWPVARPALSEQTLSTIAASLKHKEWEELCWSRQSLLEGLVFDTANPEGAGRWIISIYSNKTTSKHGIGGVWPLCVKGEGFNRGQKAPGPCVLR